MLKWSHDEHFIRTFNSLINIMKHQIVCKFPPKYLNTKPFYLPCPITSWTSLETEWEVLHFASSPWAADLISFTQEVETTWTCSPIQFPPQHKLPPPSHFLHFSMELKDSFFPCVLDNCVFPCSIRCLISLSLSQYFSSSFSHTCLSVDPPRSRPWGVKGMGGWWGLGGREWYREESPSTVVSQVLRDHWSGIPQGNRKTSLNTFQQRGEGVGLFMPHLCRGWGVVNSQAHSVLHVLTKVGSPPLRVLKWGWFCSPGDTGQCLETFLVVLTGLVDRNQGWC